MPTKCPLTRFWEGNEYLSEVSRLFALVNQARDSRPWHLKDLVCFLEITPPDIRSKLQLSGNNWDVGSDSCYADDFLLQMDSYCWAVKSILWKKRVRDISFGLLSVTFAFNKYFSHDTQFIFFLIDVLLCCFESCCSFVQFINNTIHQWKYQNGFHHDILMCKHKSKQCARWQYDPGWPCALEHYIGPRWFQQLMTLHSFTIISIMHMKLKSRFVSQHNSTKLIIVGSYSWVCKQIHMDWWECTTFYLIITVGSSGRKKKKKHSLHDYVFKC